jgi:hypothetical protein
MIIEHRDKLLISVPDGIVSYQNTNLVYFMAVRYSLLSFFTTLVRLDQEKAGNLVSNPKCEEETLLSTLLFALITFL